MVVVRGEGERRGGGGGEAGARGEGEGEGGGRTKESRRTQWRGVERKHRRVRVVRGCTALRGHGAREGDPPPLVTAAKRQDFPHRVHREMGADPCPQTEAGPTPPPEWCGGTRRHEVRLTKPSTSLVLSIFSIGQSEFKRLSFFLHADLSSFPKKLYLYIYIYIYMILTTTTTCYYYIIVVIIVTRQILWIHVLLFSP